MEGSYALRDSEQSFPLLPPGASHPGPARQLPFQQQEGFAFRTRVDVPLYTSGAIRQGIGAADADKLTAADLAVADAQRDVMMGVAEEYFAVLRGERAVEVADRTVTSSSRLGDTRMRSGAPAGDVQRRVGGSSGRVRCTTSGLPSSQSFGRRPAAYNRRLGRPLDLPRLAQRRARAHVQPGRRPPDGPGHRHPSLAGKTSADRVLERQAASQLAQNGPQVNLWGDYSYEENRYTVPQGIAEVGLGVSWNAFDGGRDRHRAAALLQQAAGLKSARADLESMLALEVRRAWLEIQETRRRLEVAGESIRRAQENTRVAQRRDTAALATGTEVLEAQLLEARAIGNHANARYDAILAYIRMERVTGRLASNPSPQPGTVR